MEDVIRIYNYVRRQYDFCYLARLVNLKGIARLRACLRRLRDVFLDVRFFNFLRKCIRFPAPCEFQASFLIL